mgnify:CR=1 FL=1
MAVTCIGNDLRLVIFLQPKAAQDKIVGLHNGELKVCITAPPIEGQANAHLLKFLSKLFKVPKSTILLEKGEYCSDNHHNRNKYRNQNLLIF